MRLGNLLCVALCLALTSVAVAQRKQLSVGDPAPGLDIDMWVKGEEVSIESGKVYVIDFWATWCVPCRRSIPHLSELQEMYGDQGLIVIGISDEDTDTVTPFVQQQGDRMDYTVATDRRKATTRAWFNAAGLKTIPAAFIVGRNGNLMFIGDPLADQAQMDLILSKVLRGRFDPLLQKQAEPVLRAARRARKVKNWRMAAKQFDDIIALDGRVFADVALERFEMMIVDMADPDAAYAYARDELSGRLFRDDADALCMLAAKITSDPKIKREYRDLEVALEAANRAQQLVERDDPQSLATLALVRFHRGDLQAAIDLQTRAYFIAHPRAKAGYKRVLSSYQEAAQRMPSDSPTS